MDIHFDFQDPSKILSLHLWAFTNQMLIKFYHFIFWTSNFYHNSCTCKPAKRIRGNEFEPNETMKNKWKSGEPYKHWSRSFQ